MASWLQVHGRECGTWSLEQVDIRGRSWQQSRGRRREEELGIWMILDIRLQFDSGEGIAEEMSILKRTVGNSYDHEGAGVM